MWVDIWGHQESNKWCVLSVCRVGVGDEAPVPGETGLGVARTAPPALLSLAFPCEVTPLGSHLVAEESGAWVIEGPGPR